MHAHVSMVSSASSLLGLNAKKDLIFSKLIIQGDSPVTKEEKGGKKQEEEMKKGRKLEGGIRENEVGEKVSGYLMQKVGVRSFQLLISLLSLFIFSLSFICLTFSACPRFASVPNSQLLMSI